MSVMHWLLLIVAIVHLILSIRFAVKKYSCCAMSVIVKSEELERGSDYCPMGNCWDHWIKKRHTKQCPICNKVTVEVVKELD